MPTVKLAVNGTLMQGLALNGNLLEVGAVFLRETTTAPCYRLWSINDVHPAMQRVESDGAAIRLEVWEVPEEGLVSILYKEPPGLCVGHVELSDDEQVLGVLGEAHLCAGQRDITEFGGWREYLGSRDPPDPESDRVTR